MVGFRTAGHDILHGQTLLSAPSELHDQNLRTDIIVLSPMRRQDGRRDCHQFVAANDLACLGYACCNLANGFATDLTTSCVLPIFGTWRYRFLQATIRLSEHGGIRAHKPPSHVPFDILLANDSVCGISRACMTATRGDWRLKCRRPSALLLRDSALWTSAMQIKPSSVLGHNFRQRQPLSEGLSLHQSRLIAPGST
jgi:hypothetical protein